jgi:hypothetical protein
MRIRHPSFVVLIAIAQTASAQDRLIPDAEMPATSKIYWLKVRDVLAQAFEEGVTTRAVVLPSFRVEYAVGLRRTKVGVEAFVVRASSSIWDVEYLKMIEEERVLYVDEEGKRVPLERNEEYQELKKNTPSDHRKIKTRRNARPIPAALAARLESVWHTAILSARYPTETGDGCDGETYHFSAQIPKRGLLSAHVWSPEPDSKTGRLVALTDALADYASGKIALKRLSEEVERASKP